MFRTFLKTSAWLIGGYLALSYASGSGTLIREGAAGLSTVVKTYQGR